MFRHASPGFGKKTTAALASASASASAAAAATPGATAAVGDGAVNVQGTVLGFLCDLFIDPSGTASSTGGATALMGSGGGSPSSDLMPSPSGGCRSGYGAP